MISRFIEIKDDYKCSWNEIYLQLIVKKSYSNDKIVVLQDMKTLDFESRDLDVAFAAIEDAALM
jgi:hypothetical protein